jgi:hypothetical protein
MLAISKVLFSIFPIYFSKLQSFKIESASKNNKKSQVAIFTHEFLQTEGIHQFVIIQLYFFAISRVLSLEFASEIIIS